MSTFVQKAKLNLSELSYRLRDPLRWKHSLYDLTVWFMFGVVITTMLSMYTPGYPIIVGTSSISPGIYWLNREIKMFMVDDYVTFKYEPTQEWLKGRYNDGREHTKRVIGVEGDHLYVGDSNELIICHPATNYKPFVCKSAGVIQEKDSKGRPMQSWIPKKYQYILQPGELWVYGEHDKSLDSRYHGPVKVKEMRGRAYPIYLW